ncbi:MAG: flavohemoglobin expression-modulating QEGLA motif protein [Proteobacteria bacterium]|nr:flavohemoglobin expression-modulating QEGLA motif protein [Pseudomonadota bacterium]MDA1354842.1 flavohemoglobin expression-modulating QEGLA motif protein [Pseudomonadota bacterium]
MNATAEFSSRERDRIIEAAAALREAERPVRMLRSVAWPEDAYEAFMAKRACALPQVTYTQIRPDETHERTRAARALIDGSSPVHHWLSRVADVVDTGANMVGAVGTKEFFELSAELYGAPNAAMVDKVTRPIDLAQALDGVLAGFKHQDLHLDESPIEYSATELVEQIRPQVVAHFGAAAPRLEIMDHLSAKAIAGGRYIRFRSDAVFSDRDCAQLIQHEAFVHIGTTLNGHEQKRMPLLAAGHPGTTRTQEGLAVFAEIISGAMDPSRMRRLADRVIAIQMAIDGADFLEIYKFFFERTDSTRQSFENARRVVRGGLVTGGAPFTKDVVYLEGLLRVHNFLRVAVQLDRLDCIRLLFCGKLNIEDLPAICILVQEGLCQFPRYLPPWVKDLRFLVSYLAYSAFLNQVNLGAIREHYVDVLQHAPKVPTPSD